MEDTLGAVLATWIESDDVTDSPVSSVAVMVQVSVSVGCAMPLLRVIDGDEPMVVPSLLHS